jgi:hypothetical protein
MVRFSVVSMAFLSLFLFTKCANASPWFDELLFEYRKHGELKYVELPQGDRVLAKVEHPVWRSAIAFYTLLGRKQGGLTGETTAYNFAAYQGPWTELTHQGQELRVRTRFVTHRTRSDSSVVHLAAEVQKKTPETTWEDTNLDLRYTGNLLYADLANGLTYSRYMNDRLSFNETLKLSEEQTRRSVDRPTFLPPTTPVEPPGQMQQMIVADQSLEMRDKELSSLKGLLAKRLLNEVEFEILDDALRRLAP